MHALCVPDPNLQAIDPQQLPGVGAKNEHITWQGLESKVFVETAHHNIFRIQYHLIIKHIRNSAPVSQGN